MSRSPTWMQTFTGLVFRPFEPTVEMICVEDIAHALSHLCRFAGHTREFYSVGEHCVRASRAILDPFVLAEWPDREVTPVELDSRRAARAALIHDAAEAYLVDIPSPIKGHIAGYKELEARLERVICERFGVPVEDLHHPLVKHVDMAMLATEARDLFGKPPQPWSDLPAPVREPIVPCTSARAKAEYLWRFGELFE